VPYRAFTVDRAGTLTPGSVLDRTIHTDIRPTVLQDHVDELFSAGVTRHGNSYFLNGRQSATAVSPNIELLFEYVRRATYDTAPSRFDSVFAWETIQDAHRFQAAPGWGNVAASQIFEVEVDAEPFKADMTCLTLQGSILIASHVANRYWQQQQNDFHILGGPPTVPLWELLLQPPVRVLAQVP
jgi:hypothetical protein